MWVFIVVVICINLLGFSNIYPINIQYLNPVLILVDFNQLDNNTDCSGKISFCLL